MAGWLRVEVGCDMKIKDERTVSHINMDIIWNVFTLISGGFQNQTPADWKNQGSALETQLANWLPIETFTYIGCKHKGSEKQFEHSTMSVIESIKLDLSVLH